MRLGVLLLVFLAMFPVVYAADYIDETIVLDNSGAAYIVGETNLDILSILSPENEVIKGYTQELTLKQGLLWKFKYVLEKNIDYNINVALPEFSEIQYIESDAKFTIKVVDNRHVISFSGTNVPMNIEIGYVTSTGSADTSSNVFLWPGIVLVLVGVLLFYFKKHKKEPKKEVKKSSKLELDEEKIKTIRLTLNENQLKILDALISKNGEASQNALKYLTGIPKSSLSRNIELMAQKNVVSKFYNGTTNHIKLHPALYSEKL